MLIIMTNRIEKGFWLLDYACIKEYYYIIISHSLLLKLVGKRVTSLVIGNISICYLALAPSVNLFK